MKEMHFCLFEFTKQGQDWEEQLAPFDENLKVKPYIEQTKDEIVKEAREHYGVRFDGMSDNEVFQAYTKDDDWEDYDKDGNLLSTYNPNAKYDYYVIGGRASRTKQTLMDEKDFCLVKDRKRRYNKETYKECLREWEITVEGALPKKGEMFFCPSKNFLTENFKDKYEYAECESKPGCYCFLFPDGTWLERGKEKPKEWVDKIEKILNEANPEWELRVLDLHI